MKNLLRAGALSVSATLLVLSFQNCSPSFETLSPPSQIDLAQVEPPGLSLERGSTEPPAISSAQTAGTAPHEQDEEQITCSSGQDMRPYWRMPAGVQLIKLFRDRYGSYWHLDSRRETSFLNGDSYRLVTVLPQRSAGQADVRWAWHSTWNYSVDARGVNEFSDQFGDLQTGALTSHVSFEEGWAIHWGSCLGREREYHAIRTVGQESGVSRATKGYDGYQMIQLVWGPNTLIVGGQSYQNVVGVAYIQAWCQDADCSSTASLGVEGGLTHAIYYLAPGKGIIRRDYYTPGFQAILKTEEVVESCSLPIDFASDQGPSFFCPKR